MLKEILEELNEKLKSSTSLGKQFEQTINDSYDEFLEEVYNKVGTGYSKKELVKDLTSGKNVGVKNINKILIDILNSKINKIAKKLVSQDVQEDDIYSALDELENVYKEDTLIYSVYEEFKSILEKKLNL